LIGHTYALRAGEDRQIAAAIEQHYQPLGPTDDVPSDPVSIVVALADKLDILVGFWVINEKPTGSKDPFALRRAALGIIRLILENKLRLNLNTLFDFALEQYLKAADAVNLQPTDAAANIDDLLSFFHDRLKVYLRDKGIRHDLIDAVITPQSDDLLAATQRAEALQNLIVSDEGENLLAGYKRAANILAAEEKKGAVRTSDIDSNLLKEDAEITLDRQLNEVEKQVVIALESEDYSAAMTFMASMRAPIDAFFDSVMVNDADENVRANRLSLLNRIRNVTGKVADFSKING